MSPLALWVLVPLKNLGRAKERLSGALAPHGFPHPVLTVERFMAAWQGMDKE